MTQITNALWQTELPNIPKPDGLEYFDFITIVKRKVQQQKRGEPMIFLRALSKLESCNEDPGAVLLIRELIEWEVENS